MCMYIFTNNNIYTYIFGLFTVYHSQSWVIIIMFLGSDAQNWRSPLSTATSWNDAVISQSFLLGQLQKNMRIRVPVSASNWKTDVPEFLRMLIVCCSCSRYFFCFEDAPSGSVCTLEKVWAQTFRKYKNANHHRVQKHRTKSLRAFVFPSESGRSGNTQNLYQILDAQKTHK